MVQQHKGEKKLFQHHKNIPAIFLPQFNILGFLGWTLIKFNSKTENSASYQAHLLKKKEISTSKIKDHVLLLNTEP